LNKLISLFLKTNFNALKELVFNIIYNLEFRKNNRGTICEAS